MPLAAPSKVQRHNRAMGGSNMPMAGMPNMTPQNRLASPGGMAPVSPVAQFGQPATPMANPMMGAAVSPQMQPRMASGGNVPQFAAGGLPSAAETDPWYMKQEAHSQFHPGGMFSGTAPGRADTLPRDVPVNSHVIPADVVASIGQGNSLSGGNALEGMFHSLPYGVQGGRGHAGTALRPPAAPRPMQFDSAGGRKTAPGHSVVPIAASSGEFLVKPEGVYREGMRTILNHGKDPNKFPQSKIMDIGHDAIDSMILEVRKREIKTLKKLPPPRKD